MRQMLDLAAEPRPLKGKGPAYQLRLKGRIPAIVYGGKADPEQVQVDAHNFVRVYGGGAMLQTLVMLDVNGKKTRVIPRAIQLDPVSDRPIHIDFMRLEPGARLRIAIPVHFSGQENSPGIKRGGVLNVVRHEIEILCSADAIPDTLEANISELDIGDSLHISRIALPEGVTPVIQGRDFTIATLAPPTTFVEETPTAAAATTEGAEGAAPAAGAEGAAPAAGAAAPAAKGKAPEKK